MSTRACLPWPVKYVASHARKAQVTTLTGLPAQSATACGGRSAHRTITGYRFALWVLSRYRHFHQADGLVVAPGMHVRLGFTAPPHVIFEAQYKVRMIRSHLDQAVPAFFSARRPVGTDHSVFARGQLTPKRTMASSMVGHDRVVSLKPCS